MVSFQKEKSGWDLYTFILTNLISGSSDNVLSIYFTVSFLILHHQQFCELNE